MTPGDVVRLPHRQQGVPPMDARTLQKILRDARAANDPAPLPAPPADPALVAWFRRNRLELTLAIIAAPVFALGAFAAALVMGAGQ